MTRTFSPGVQVQKYFLESLGWTVILEDTLLPDDIILKALVLPVEVVDLQDLLATKTIMVMESEVDYGLSEIGQYEKSGFILQLVIDKNKIESAYVSFVLVLVDKVREQIARDLLEVLRRLEYKDWIYNTRSVEMISVYLPKVDIVEVMYLKNKKEKEISR